MYTTRLTIPETGLLAAVALAIALACLGPATPQYAHYHAFADQRMLWGVPHALDVLSNLPFALAGAWGLQRLSAGGSGQPTGAQRAIAVLFFSGLVVTALCSTWYHIQPDTSGLAVDRVGMVCAFAGLLGLAVADRVSARAGYWTTGAVFALGPVSVYVWVVSTNLLPWAVLQGGAMLLLLLLALRKPVPGAWGLPLAGVIAWYVLAKLFELGDYFVFDLTDGWIAGHTLKHIAAALAAWPVLGLMHNAKQTPAAVQLHRAPDTANT